MSKKLLLSLTVAFIIIFLFDFLYNSFALKNFYLQSANYGLSENAIKKFVFWSLICHLVGAIILNIHFSLKNIGTNWKDGLIYGLLIGCLLSIKSLIFYAFMPLPFVLPVLWFIGSIVEFSLVGVVIAKINR